MLKRLKSIFLTLAYAIVCGEIAVRGLAWFMPIYDIEMIRYANSLKFASPHPVLSHEHVPNASAHLMGVEVELDELGHRNSTTGDTSESDEFRIYVAGSSITMGWGVAEEETFSATLQRRLNTSNAPDSGLRYTVKNAGVGNYTTVYQVELFEKQVDLVKPDLAILQYFVNDAEPNPDDADNPIFKYSYFAALAYVKIRVVFFNLFKSESLDGYYADLYNENQPGWQAVQRAVRKMQAICAERGISMIVLMVPDLHNLDLDGPYPPIYDKVTGSLAELGIEVANAYPKVAEKYSNNPLDAWISSDDAHPNAQTHAIFADVLFEKLTRSGGLLNP